MPAAGLYIATAIGAIALYLMMPRRGFNPRVIGALLGAATVGGLWLWLAGYLPEAIGISNAAFIYYYVFSGIGIAAAARVITHDRPVYSALWFVMVVLATSGLLLVLNAEFMAFAMVIIYGGAILVTYMFVIMLASQSIEAEDDTQVYDGVAREPATAIAAGFLLLAAVLTVTFDPEMVPNPAAAGESDASVIATVLTGRTGEALAEAVGDRAVVGADTLGNVERVGLDLFRSHPLGLELAGVILLVSLIGAVVIARQKAMTGVDEEGGADA